MVFNKPLTLLFFLCMCGICLSVIGAVICHDQKDSCSEGFSAPIAALCCVGCMVALFSVFYVESMGHNTGFRGA